ncbi:MAG: hypothetical protein WCK77_12875 [Verrucomicrobiota bacterium]
MNTNFSPATHQTPATDPPNPAAPAPDLLLVCLQDPYPGVGASSALVHSTVPAADGNVAHQWMLEAVLEMNPPRFFESWATRGSFTLDLSVTATALPASGTWGGTVSTFSGSGNCRVVVMRDGDNKLRFSLDSDARHAPEMSVPAPDELRFLNADIAFDVNGKNGLSAGAVAVISSKPWSRLIAGSTAPTQGLAFDGGWRRNLAEGDGDSMVAGTWAFMVMTPEAYQALCVTRNWVPYVLD